MAEGASSSICRLSPRAKTCGQFPNWLSNFFFFERRCHQWIALVYDSDVRNVYTHDNVGSGHTRAHGTEGRERGMGGATHLLGSVRWECTLKSQLVNGIQLLFIVVRTHTMKHRHDFFSAGHKRKFAWKDFTFSATETTHECAAFFCSSCKGCVCTGVVFGGGNVKRGAHKDTR